MARADRLIDAGQGWRLATLFVYGWREVFIPLAVLAHGQHGSGPMMAGLAVAAARVGGWVTIRLSGQRSPRRMAILAGIALALLGLTPEEGPAGLLLWLVFGIAWAALEAALAGRAVRQWLAWLILLAGMALAGPLALGPGAWLVAGLCFVVAWRFQPVQETVAAQPPEPVVDPAAQPGGLLPFFFSLSYLGWIWLVPAMLLVWQVPVVWIGVTVGAGWLARLLAARGMAAISVSRGVGWWQAGAAVTLALVLATLGFAVSGLAGLMAVLVVSGAALGMVAVHGAIARPELDQLPGEAQALGEIVAPVVGALLWLLAGQGALFVAVAIAALGMAVLLVRDTTGSSELAG